MRTIKFRGKRINRNGEWAFGDLRILPDRTLILPQGSYDAAIDRDAVDEKTIGQYTGLVDKNGKEIYEGDIVECVSWNEYFSKDGQPIEPFRRKMYVDFRNGGFKMVEPMPYEIEPHEWDIIYNGDIVNIGNIHDNPELLKNNT